MDATVDFVREASINWLLIVWVDEARAHEIEDEGAQSKTSDNYACDEPGTVGEPEPAMLHRHHVSHPVAEAIAA